ncbi:MAG TPA: BBE domain-containing protein, partial [Gaiellaceae bacterium]|nr:BBE domain-containing protein [Gaiellaceae bacterium]
VTSFEYRLHPVSEIYAGPLLFELDDAQAVLQWYRDYIKDAPEELSGFPAWQIAPPLPFIPEDRHGDTFLIFVTCWTGPVEHGEAALKPLRDVAPVAAEHVGPMPYPALNSAFDALVPAGLQHYWKARFANELTDDAIAAHLEHGPKVPVVNSTVHIYPINGAAHRVAPDATAFAYRDATFATVIAGMWPDPAENDANTRWVRDFYDAIAPYSEEGGYINFMGADDQGRIRANYRDNYDRLVELKRKYDPNNLFRLNQNIEP